MVFSAQGFLAFMSGYTVFSGPFAGIMVTDVCSQLQVYDQAFSDFKTLSIGSSIAARLTFHPCTDLTDDIGTLVAS